IVPVFGVGEEGGTHYYVMQYIEGRPLDEVLAELRRLRAEGGPRAALATAPGAAADVSGAVPPVEAKKPSSARVARSLWQAQFLPGSRTELGAAADGPAVPDRAASTPMPVTPGAGPPGSAPSSGPLSDPNRPYAQSVAQLGVQVAEALEYAAGQGVLHRDV